MATVKNTDICIIKTVIQVVDLRTNPSKTQSLDPETISLKQYQPSFLSLTGQFPSHALILTSATSSCNPFFHHGCVYFPDHDELYITSDLLQSTSSSQLPVILISKVSFRRSATEDLGEAITTAEWMKLRPPPNMPMPSGACAHERGIVFCSQGSLAAGTGGLFYMPLNKPPLPIITCFGDRPFNSPQQVTLARDGSLWFTDSCSGFEADIRKLPSLPNQVYRYEPDTGSLRVVADGLERPNGICFSPGGETIYVTDTDAVRVNKDQDATRAATIYAWDVIIRSGQPFLANKRVFAFALNGVPKMVLCDGEGNVYAACGDGVEVWDAGGLPLGLVEIPGGCSSFSFGRMGEIFVCAKERLWRIQLQVTATL